MAHSRSLSKDGRVPLYLSPPGYRCDVLGSVANSSTHQTFGTHLSHLCWLLCLSVHLLVYFPSLRHVQDSTSTGVFVDECRILAHAASLVFPVHVSPCKQAHRIYENDGASGLTVSPLAAVQRRACVTASVSISNNSKQINQHVHFFYLRPSGLHSHCRFC